MSVDGFEGPLDWLVELARSRRIDLAQLSIAAVMDVFGAALVAALARRDTPDAGAAPAVLGHWGGWTVMAAELALLRSRLLLPQPDDDASADAEHDGPSRLSREEIARAADWLRARPQLGQDVFARGLPDHPGLSRGGRQGSITALLRACLAALELPPDADSFYRVPTWPYWTAADAAARIRRLLAAMGPEAAGLDVFLPEMRPDAPDLPLRRRAAVAGTFLAGLELARSGTVTLQQSGAWDRVSVRRSGPDDAG